MKKLKFYKMNSEYIDYLKSFDRSVPDVRYQAHDRFFVDQYVLKIMNTMHQSLQERWMIGFIFLLNFLLNRSHRSIFCI